MKNLYIYSFALLLLCFQFSCEKSGAGADGYGQGHDHGAEGHASQNQELVHLVQEQMDVMEIGMGGFQTLNLKSTIKANGQLELPPQNKASVSSLMSGRVKSINIAEGNHVRKGQVLARLEHPEYLLMQEQYLAGLSDFQLSQQEHNRHEILIKDSIISQKEFDRSESDLGTNKARLSILKAKLEMVGISVKALESGTISTTIPILSPISGHVQKVEINMGMSVTPEQELFEIVDNEHIHIDLMVYEKDIDKVRENQKVMFSLTTQPDQVFEGKVFSIGKAFENDPKAVAVHAEIDNKQSNLLPGMYVDGRIQIGDQKVLVLPNEAIVEEGGLNYIFVRESSGSGGHDDHAHAHADESEHDHGDDHAHADESEHDHGDDHAHADESEHDHGDDAHAHSTEYTFRKVEVNTGVKDIGFTEVVPAQKVAANAQIVTQNAFYLLAELKKGEPGAHGHPH